MSCRKLPFGPTLPYIDRLTNDGDPIISRLVSHRILFSELLQMKRADSLQERWEMKDQEVLNMYARELL